jgi:integrase
MKRMKKNTNQTKSSPATVQPLQMTSTMYPNLANPFLLPQSLPAPVRLQDAADQFLKQSNKETNEYRKKVNVTITTLALKCRPNLALLGVPPSMINDFLEAAGSFAGIHGPWSVSTKRFVLAHISAFFNWAFEYYGYRPKNPASQIHFPQQYKSWFHPLDLDESQRLLDSYWCYHNGVYLPRLLLEGWAALRPVEIERFDLSKLNLENGWVVVGSHTRRRVELADTTVLMLRILKQRGILSEKSFRPSRHARNEMIAMAELTPGRMHAGLLRHTAITYYLARCHDVVRTALWAGASPILFSAKHQGLVESAQVEVFWAMLPSGLRSNGSVGQLHNSVQARVIN